MFSINFLNVDIPKQKNLEIALSFIYGIGRKKAIFICKKLGFNSKSKFGLLNEKALKNLSGFIDFYFIHGYTLKRLKRQRLDFLVKIKTYRGTRLVSGLLVRGQKSRNKKLRKYF
jgi:small subunit ribosomal protein S13